MIGIAVMEDNTSSNSSRGNECGDGEEEEEREQGIDEKGSSSSSLIGIEGSSVINPPR